MIDLKVRKLFPDARLPTRANETDAGLDLYHNWEKQDGTGDIQIVEIGTGIAVEIPEGHVGLVFPRSSISNKDVRLTNSVGVIDSGYRGEIILKFDLLWFDSFKVYNKEERIGQLIVMPIPAVSLVEVEELSESERGSGGFGSSGK